jgi:type IV pilus assembly protein PilB
MEKITVNSFARHLVRDYGLKQEIFDEMITYAKEQNISFITHLIQAQKIDSNYLARLLAQEFFLEYVDLDSIDIWQIPSNIIDKELMKKYQILPLRQDKQQLILALVDPTQQFLFDELRFCTQLMLDFKLADEKKLINALKKIQSISPKKEDSKVKNQNLFKKLKDINNVDVKLTNLSNDDLTMVNYVNQILMDAFAYNASDIHIEPYQNQLEIRFRIDGLLYLMLTLPKNLIPRIITRLKIMSQLDIAERRIPQDGRFQIKDNNDRTVDCRLSTCPTIHGEKLVIRILDSNKMLLEIDKLGMDLSQKKEFIKALKSPHGMILVTGPTGSGKTITLYTALNFLKKTTVNISTVENPIEIILPGINQVNVNSTVGLNFSCVLRAFLRQDPDIIMVGEMRDQETAEIGIKAAQTGHLVLSTLHTNSAADSLIRLESMNIPSYNIAASVQLIIAQRLVRRLCVHCKIEEKLPKDFLLQLDRSNTKKFYTATGCSQCINGYKGRTGIFEVLILTEGIKKMILKKNNAIEISHFAQKQGMKTLYASALEKLKQGEISLLEMKRIIKD